jgi:hypothetical protein
MGGSNRLDDIEAIKQVKARLSRANDLKDWPAARAQLADDFEMTAPSGHVVRGADAFIAFVSSALGDVSTVHMGHLADIELTSDTTAKGTWLVEDLNAWPNGRELHGYGLNDDTYVKVDGDWKVATASMRLLGEPFSRPTYSVTGLAAKQEITEVLHRYCQAMDRIDNDLGYRVWHDDGTVDYEGTFQGTGREFVDWVLDQHRKMVKTFHQVTNVMIELDGDRAESECYAFACNRVGDRDFVMRGRYLDSFTRRDGEWRIQHRRFVSDIMQVLPSRFELPPL